MSNPNRRVHAKLRLQQGLVFENGADITPEEGMIATVDGMPCVFTTIDGIQAWYPLAKGADNVTYNHSQTTASDHWVVNHGLGSQDLWFNIRDGDGDFVATTLGVEADATDPDNVLHFYFAAPITGSVFVIGTKAFSSPVINTSELNIGGTVVIDSTSMRIGENIISLADLLSATDKYTRAEVDALLANFEGGSAATLRSMRAVYEGPVVAGNINTPWYPPADATAIKAVRIQLSAIGGTDLVVSLRVVRGVAEETTQYTLPAGSLNNFVSNLNIDITNDARVYLAIVTAAGTDLIVTLEYL